MTVAPPASRPLTTCAAIEFGATPVTTAMSFVKRDASGTSATDSRASVAMRSKVSTSRPWFLDANHLAWSATSLPAPTKLRDSTDWSPL